MPHYCDIAPGHPFHGPYHDTEYGFPSLDEKVLFERLCLEIMQAGLSWEIVLKKREAFRKAFKGFDVAKVAKFTMSDIERLLGDEGIIRNRRKIEAIIENARRIVKMDGIGGWLYGQPEMTKAEWVKLFKKTFLFMGGEIVGEFLMSLGLLPGAHRPDCPVFKKIEKQKTVFRKETKAHAERPTKKARRLRA